MLRFAPIVICILAFALQGFTLWKPLLITDDIAQHHVWLDEEDGSGLQPGDPWIATSKAIQPYVAAALFKAVRVFLPTLLVGKALALALLALTGVLVYRIGVFLRGVRMGWIAVGLFLISDAWIGLSGGFARSFAWPLVCGLVLALLHRRQGWAAMCLFLAAALYPVAFVLLSPVYALVWVADQARDQWRQAGSLRTLWKTQWPLVLAVAAGSALVLLKSREIGLNPLVGPQVTQAQMQADPLYAAGGRVPLLPVPPLLGILPWALLPWTKAAVEPLMRHGAAFAGPLQLVLNAASILAFLLAMVMVWRRSREKAMVLLALAAAGMATYILATLLLPRLFEPSRYMIWSMPVLGVLSWAVLLDSGLGLLKAGRGRMAGGICLALVVLSRAPSIQGKGADDASEYAGLYLALARTGGEELVASFPRTSDFIPVLCHRSVFVSNESSHAVLFTGYRRLVMERNAALLKAFYSASQNDVKDFCAQNKIDWLVVEEKYYLPDLPPGVHFAPFDRQLREMLKQTPQPWLLTYAKKSGKQVQSGVYLVPAGPIIDSSSLP